MVVELLVALIAVVVVYELFEHVIIPLVAQRALRGQAALTGPEGLVGRTAEVRRWSGTRGTVFVNGELWEAESRLPVAVGDRVTVLAVSNLSLRVEPAADR